MPAAGKLNPSPTAAAGFRCWINNNLHSTRDGHVEEPVGEAKRGKEQRFPGDWIIVSGFLDVETFL